VFASLWFSLRKRIYSAVFEEKEKTLLDNDPLLHFSEKVFSILMFLYPRAYRDSYGEEMADIFKEISRDVYASKGPIGLFVEWVHTLADVPGHAMIERVDHIQQRKSSQFLRASGYASIFAGLSGALITSFNPGHENLSRWLAVFLFTVSLLAISGIYFFQVDYVSPKSIYGFTIMSIGLVFELLELPTSLTSAAYLAGMLFIAITTIRIKRFSPAPSVLWLASPLVGLPAIFMGGIEHILFKFGAVLFGLGYVFFGIDMLGHRAESGPAR